MKKPTFFIALALSAGLLVTAAPIHTDAAVKVVQNCSAGTTSCNGINTASLKKILKNCDSVDTKTANQILKKCSAGGNCSKVDTAALQKTLKNCSNVDNAAIKQILKQCKKAAASNECTGTACKTNTTKTNTTKPFQNCTNPTGNTSTSTPANTTDANSSDTYILQVVELVNEARAEAGLSPVTLQTDVTNAAQVRAKEIETTFSHTRPNGSSCFTALKEANVSYRGAGENIAYGQRSAQEVMNGWMNSSGHRANILNPSFTKIGVGHYQNAAGVHYWTQMFIY